MEDYTDLVDCIQTSTKQILVFANPHPNVRWMHSSRQSYEWDRASPSHAVWDHYYPNFTRRTT